MFWASWAETKHGRDANASCDRLSCRSGNGRPRRGEGGRALFRIGHSARSRCAAGGTGSRYATGAARPCVSRRRRASARGAVSRHRKRPPGAGAIKGRAGLAIRVEQPAFDPFPQRDLGFDAFFLSRLFAREPLPETRSGRAERPERRTSLAGRERLSLSLRPMAAMPSRFDSTTTRGTRRSYRRSSLSTPLECLGEGFEPLDLIWKRVAVYPAERDLGAGKERNDALGRHQHGLAETPEAGRALIEGAGGCTPSQRRPEGSVRRSSPCGACGGAKHGVDGGASLPSDE
jgi:hypothetical protein